MSTRELAPLTVSAAEAAALLGVSRSTWLLWNDAGTTPRGLKIGGRRLWDYGELQQWISAGAPPRTKWEALRGAAR